MTRELLRSLRQLLGSWWRVDRIRIPATTGRLFQLAPGDRLLIGGNLLVVRRRSLLDGPDSADGEPSEPRGVDYRLGWLGNNTDGGEVGHAHRILSPDDPWRLQILLPSDGRSHCHRLWMRGVVEELLDEEIVVLRSR